jgi:hypothetical protein
MTSTRAVRAAAYVGGGALLIAWFAAAAISPVQQPAPPRDSVPRAAPTSGTASLAADVQAQATKLRERLAQAPAPAVNSRNPFSFAPPPAARVPAIKASAPEPAPSPELVVPALSLMGVAEEMSPEGLHRTAVIGGANDAIYMAMEGQTVTDRYRVTTIGQDAVELKDLITGAYRRLAMR